MATQAINPAVERNKMIAAIVLGLLALIALYFAFGRGLFTSKAPTAASSPTPKPSVSPSRNAADLSVPTAAQQNLEDTTTLVSYSPNGSNAPDPGRNIFAFYEPPAPTPYSPTPIPTPTIDRSTPVPTPKPYYEASFINPQMTYAGTNGIRIEVNGVNFDQDAHIYFNQVEMPTSFINATKLIADIPAAQISTEGQRQVIVQSPDGKKYSTQFMIAVQAPPKPAFKYIGMIGRKRFNNDTGYFIDPAKSAATPFGARLNDVVGGRFRLIKLTPGEAVFEDSTLGFKHRVPIEQSTGVSTSGPPLPNRLGPQIDPSQNYQPQQQLDPGNCPAGIPCQQPRIQPQPGQPPPGAVRQKGQKEDVDDNDENN